jgi:hypothetical protein
MLPDIVVIIAVYVCFRWDEDRKAAAIQALPGFT